MEVAVVDNIMVVDMVADSSTITVASKTIRMVITRVITATSSNNITEEMPITATPIKIIMLDLVNSEHDFTSRRESEGWIKKKNKKQCLK